MIRRVSKEHLMQVLGTRANLLKLTDVFIPKKQYLYVFRFQDLGIESSCSKKWFDDNFGLTSFKDRAEFKALLASLKGSVSNSKSVKFKGEPKSSPFESLMEKRKKERLRKERVQAFLSKTDKSDYPAPLYFPKADNFMFTFEDGFKFQIGAARVIKEGVLSSAEVNEYRRQAKELAGDQRNPI
jgi:hypothetical protein